LSSLRAQAAAKACAQSHTLHLRKATARARAGGSARSCASTPRCTRTVTGARRRWLRGGCGAASSPDGATQPAKKTRENAAIAAAGDASARRVAATTRHHAQLGLLPRGERC
jgi:hypothetical protein